MALRNQPYLPLYVQDYLTDEKLNSCSPASQGVYIKIMCILHKQEEYGTLNLFKQKDKQNTSKVLNFACKFAKLLPFDQETILKALEELIDEGVLIIENDKIFQKRMVKDGAISEARSKAGKSGGGNPILFKQIPKQTDKQITEIEYANEIESEIIKQKNLVLFSDFKDLESELLESESWIETTAMRWHIETDKVKEFINLFCLDQQAKEPGARLLGEYKRHFVNWIGTQLEKENKLNGKVLKKNLTYLELSDLASKNLAKFSDYEVQKDKTWKLK